MNITTIRRAALVALTSLGLAGAAEAQALNIPLGMTVDTAGNLYVANGGDNDVLVYNKAYTLANTLTGNMSSPTSVAIDPTGGYLYVTNEQSGDILIRKLSGQETDNLISDPTLGAPVSCLIDSLGDLWVMGVTGRIHVYPWNGIDNVLGTQVNTDTGATALAIAGPFLNVWGAPGALPTYSAAQTYHAGDVIAGTTLPGEIDIPIASIGAAATDAAGNSYLTDRSHNQIALRPLLGGSPTAIINTSYPPYGIAVDQANLRLYVSSAATNAIYVYSLKAPYKLLHVIK